MTKWPEEGWNEEKVMSGNFFISPSFPYLLRERRALSERDKVKQIKEVGRERERCSKG